MNKQTIAGSGNIYNVILFGIFLSACGGGTQVNVGSGGGNFSSTENYYIYSNKGEIFGVDATANNPAPIPVSLNNNGSSTALNGKLIANFYQGDVHGNILEHIRLHDTIVLQAGQLYKIPTSLDNATLNGLQLANTSNETFCANNLPGPMLQTDYVDTSNSQLIFPVCDGTNTVTAWKMVRLNMTSTDLPVTVAPPLRAIHSANGALVGYIVQSNYALHVVDSNFLNPTPISLMDASKTHISVINVTTLGEGRDHDGNALLFLSISGAVAGVTTTNHYLMELKISVNGEVIQTSSARMLQQTNTNDTISPIIVAESTLFYSVYQATGTQRDIFKVATDGTANNVTHIATENGTIGLANYTSNNIAYLVTNGTDVSIGILSKSSPQISTPTPAPKMALPAGASAISLNASSRHSIYFGYTINSTDRYVGYLTDGEIAPVVQAGKWVGRAFQTSRNLFSSTWISYAILAAPTGEISGIDTGSNISTGALSDPMNSSTIGSFIGRGDTAFGLVNGDINVLKLTTTNSFKSITSDGPANQKTLIAY